MHSKDPLHSGFPARIDHTELRAEATYEDIRRLCLEALYYGFGAVIIQPIHCERAARHVQGSGVGVVAVVGFPTGAFTIDGKTFEAHDAILRGATEVGYVINVGALRSANHDLVLEEMRALRHETQGHTLRAILEACVLTDEEKRLACELAVEAGIDCVATSASGHYDGAMIEDVRLMRKAVGNAVGVAASGGFADARTALEMLDAGASRLGTDASVRIAEEWAVGSGTHEEGL